MSDRIDPQEAIAEAQLDRFDDAEDHPVGSMPIQEDVPEMTDGMHIEDRDTVARDRRGRVIPDEPAEDDPDELELTNEERKELVGVDTEVADALDSLAEAYNARDLDGVLELVADDCETPGLATDVDAVADAFEDLWERRPTTLVVRGELNGEPVGVLWEVGGEGADWWPIASLHLADVQEGRIGVIEFLDDAMVLDEIEADPPDGDLEEGTRWEEWEEGAEV